MNISTWAWNTSSSVTDVLRVLGADHAVAPLEDLVAVLAGHADELGDHLERQLGGDVDDEVDLVALGHAPRRAPDR